MLDECGIRNLLVTGTKTNVCCEATARDAMMLDYNTVMMEEEHRATLETFIHSLAMC